MKISKGLLKFLENIFVKLSGLNTPRLSHIFPSLTWFTGVDIFKNIIFFISGFGDAGYEERSIYELPDLESELSTLLSQVLPLYKQLYTYVRRRLVDYYGTRRVKPDSPIPAHVLGNMKLPYFVYPTETFSTR